MAEKKTSVVVSQGQPVLKGYYAPGLVMGRLTRKVIDSAKAWYLVMVEEWGLETMMSWTPNSLGRKQLICFQWSWVGGIDVK